MIVLYISQSFGRSFMVMHGSLEVIIVKSFLRDLVFRTKITATLFSARGTWTNAISNDRKMESGAVR